MNNLSNIELKEVPNHIDTQGYLVAYDLVDDIDFDLKRIFIVSSHIKAQRGKHAHKSLTQVLICVSGSCLVTVDDGVNRKEILLDKPSLALKIPPHIWAEQCSLSNNTVIVVACDLPFNESDYIRNYNDFLNYRKEGIES